MNRRYKFLFWALAVILIVFVSGLTIIIIRNRDFAWSIGGPIISIIIASLITLVVSVFSYFELFKRSRGLLHSKTEEIIQLQQQKDKLEENKQELEEQKQELEARRQTFSWYLEAAELADEDPRLSIVIAWQALEIEIQRVVNLLSPIETPVEIDKLKYSALRNIGFLERYLNKDEVEIIKHLYNLRNRIVHGEVRTEEISEEKVMNYIQQTVTMTRIISSLTGTTNS